MGKLDECRQYAEVEILGQSQSEAAEAVAWLVGEVERLTKELAEANAFYEDCARADKASGQELIRQRDEAKAALVVERARSTFWRAAWDCDRRATVRPEHVEPVRQALAELRALGGEP